MDQLVAAGGNFIDTADIYQMGLSETYIGTWLAKHTELRKKLIIATELSASMDHSDPNSCGLSRHHIMQPVELLCEWQGSCYYLVVVTFKITKVTALFEWFMI